ncbi:unnamed protein product [Penicillium salamii]|uniref:Extracellular membrane protein CFEM domain-containing protein n=1 Tax=Penicillium salamii TaxID=1612424 RepID=A0A9W4NCI9_9EURO|nr:unnamed protein product [Penicillium salamii]
MISPKLLLALAATLAALSGSANAQTNITEKACASSSDFSRCNRDVAEKWSSCVRDCNGNGHCIVDCGCDSHRKYINCMAESCWNQVYSCKYQLFIQQYFAVCPSAHEPIPFWPAPKNAPNRCSCDVAKVVQTTLTSRKEQVNCIRNATENISTNISDLSNLNTGLDIAGRTSDCACCGASASISASWDICPHTEPRLAGADMWNVFFPSSLPNLYTSVPDWAWSSSSCDSKIDSTKCKSLGFTADKFYKPGDYPKNGTSTLSEIAGTVSAPPSGTVLTWSQASSTYTVTATGYDRKAVASQSEYRATATGDDDFATQTSHSAADAVGVRNGGLGAVVGAAFAVLML